MQQLGVNLNLTIFTLYNTEQLGKIQLIRKKFWCLGSLSGHLLLWVSCHPSTTDIHRGRQVQGDIAVSLSLLAPDEVVVED